MLGQFHHLLVLDAAYSDLEWVEPELFNHLTRLETLHLEAGRLRAVNNLAAMKHLRRVYLQHNQLTHVVALDTLYSPETTRLPATQSADTRGPTGHTLLT